MEIREYEITMKVQVHFTTTGPHKGGREEAPQGEDIHVHKVYMGTPDYPTDVTETIAHEVYDLIEKEIHDDL